MMDTCYYAAAAAAKSLQSCLTLCDPTDGSPPGSPVPGILQARTLEWVAISFSNAWKWKVKVKSLSRVRLLATPWTAAHQAPPSMGFSRQEYCHRLLPYVWWVTLYYKELPAWSKKVLQLYFCHFWVSWLWNSHLISLKLAFLLTKWTKWWPYTSLWRVLVKTIDVKSPALSLIRGDWANITVHFFQIIYVTFVLLNKKKIETPFLTFNVVLLRIFVPCWIL